jgi:hypothetical protein
MCLAETSTNLPFWFNFWFPLGNALLTLALAAATACFAWGQHSLGRSQLKVALFDRRVIVYEAMKRFVADTMSGGTTTMDSMISMLRETRYAPFLFERRAGISEYIGHFYKQGVELKYAQQGHERIRSAQEEPERLRLIQRQHDLLLWFTAQGDVIDEKFRPYLQLW